MTSTSISRTEKMIATKDGPIGWIVFNNPARRNAVSVEMWEALSEIVRDYASDPAIRVIVLRGAGGKAFVSGADISEFEQKRATPEATEAYRQLSERATTDLQYVNKPTIAMIEGFCIGGGVSVALSCDLRIACESARFGVPAARLGLGYELPGVRKLVQVVGPAFAKEIFYTARQFTAQEALAMGLINAVVEPGDLDAEVDRWCDEILRRSPQGLRLAKIALNTATDALYSSTNHGMELMALNHVFGDEPKEGILAFQEKRAPDWRRFRQGQGPEPEGS